MPITIEFNEKEIDYLVTGLRIYAVKYPKKQFIIQHLLKKLGADPEIDYSFNKKNDSTR